jgi:general nucleoside transport system permease protein
MTAGLETGTVREPSTAPRRRTTLPLVLLYISGALFVLALVSQITGADDIASSGTLSAALVLAVPIGMAGLGGLWSERAGIVNIGLEGMMILGTWGAGFGGYQWGPWAGVALGVFCGALGGLLHAVATVTFGVDHIISGVAINILGLGTAQYLAAVAFVGKPGGGSTQSPQIPDLPELSVPGASKFLGDIENNDWFFVSEVAAALRAVTVGVSALTVICVALLVATFYILWRTAFGLRLRSCGENPVAAESLGVNVYKYKYYAVIASGAFAGLGGAFLAIVAASAYRDGQTGGRGYIGLAAMICGNWRPGGLAAGAALFGYTDALQLRRGAESVHALLLVVAIGLLAVAVLQLVRRRLAPAAITAVFAALVLAWYLTTDEVPSSFTGFTPHVTTLVVLAFTSQRLRMPAADGMVYRRGQGA